MSGKLRDVLAVLILSVLFISISFLPAWSQSAISGERYDNSRLGSNLSEFVLNTSNVNVNQFGKLFTDTVDGSIQAQPLYVPNVAIPNKGTHNVLYVVTMNDVVYAFDADSNAGANASPLWIVDFRASGITPVPITDIVGANNLNIVGNVGIESTPVIDLTTNTMYLVARTKESGSYFQRLHALNITNGAERTPGPVTITASVSGNGAGSMGNRLTFDPKIENQRTSLALANGMVFIAWASHEDMFNYHGWIIAYNTATLAQAGVYCVTPSGAQGGVWQSGRAPVVDASGNIYFISGNGDWNGTTNYGESFLKFSTGGGTFSLADWFTPDNWSSLNGGDSDLGASGPLLIPGTNLLVGGGKQSLLYVVQSSNLGHEQSGNAQIVQVLTNNGGEIKGGPVYYDRSTAPGPWLYLWSNEDYLKAYHFNGTRFDANPVSRSTFTAPAGSSGGVLTLTANGNMPGTGIVWSSMPLDQDGDHGVVTGVLRAFDASDLTKELWNSHLNPTHDDVGLWPKYSPPTVVNGKLYMASFSNVVSVYGLLSTTPDFTMSVSPTTAAAVPGGSGAGYTVNAGSLNGFSGNVDLSVSGLPSGADASFSAPQVGVPGSATITVRAGSATPIGSYSLTVTGTSASVVHTATTNLVVSSTIPGQGTISINFVGRGTAMGNPETAGLIARSNWNNATAATSMTPLSLVDETGTATGAAATWASNNTWSTPIVDQAGNYRMAKGYLDTGNGNPSHVTVSGLRAGWAYDVYVYADGDNGGASRTANYQISGAGITTTSTNLTDPANTNFTGAFTQANNSNGNYVKFSINATGFTLTAAAGTSTDAYPRAPVSGIQVIPVSIGPDFTIAATPSSRTVHPGESALYTVNISALNGLTDAVGLSAGGLPSGTTASFNPASISGSNSSTLTVTTTSGTPAGNPTIAITGTSGSLVHSTTVSLVVQPPPNFTISATPASQTVNPGGNALYTVNVAALNGFSDAVSLSVSGLPSGTTASFNPASISGSNSSTFTVTTTSGTPAGSPALTISGTSGSLVHSTAVTLVVPPTDFTISATPASQTVNPGGNALYTVNVAALGGFRDAVSLSVSGLPSGTTALFNPASISGSNSSTLTVTTTSTTPAGSPTLTITGTSGTLIHSVNVSLVVSTATSGQRAISVDFVGSGSAMASSETAGVVAKSHWNNAANASGNITRLMDETGAATNVSAAWSSDNVWSTGITNTAGNLRMMKGYMDNGSQKAITVTIAGLPSAAYDVYVYADGDNATATRTGAYQITGAGITTTSVNLTNAANNNFSGTFTQANNSNGNYVKFSINGTGFTVTATPGAATDSVKRAPINGIQIIPR